MLKGEKNEIEKIIDDIQDDPYDQNYDKALPLIIKHLKPFQEALKGISSSQAKKWSILAFDLKEKEYYAHAQAIYSRLKEIKPDDPSIHQSLAEISEKLGDHEAAEKEYRQCLKLDPGYTSISDNLAEVLENRGKIREAVKIYEKEAKRDPSRASEKYGKIGSLLQRNGNIREAERAYRQAVRESKSITNYRDLGWFLSKQKRLIDAEKIYKEGIKDNPLSASLYGDLARILWSLRKNDEAEWYYRQAIRLGRHPVASYYYLAVLLKEAGKKDESLAVVTEALKRYAKSDVLHVPQHYYYARLLEENGELERARKKYQKAIEKNPMGPTAYNALAALLEKEGGGGKLYQAEALYRKADLLGQGEPKFKFDLARFLEKKIVKEKNVDNKEIDEVERLYRQVIEADPTNSAAYNNLSNILRRKREYSDAREVLNKALKHLKELPSESQTKVVTSTCWLICETACNLFQLGDFRATRKSVDSLLGLIKRYRSPVEPKNDLLSQAYFLLGSADLQQRHSYRAIKNLQKAAVLNPQDASIRYNLAQAYYWANKNREAVQVLEDAIQLKSKENKQSKEVRRKYPKADELLDTIHKLKEPIRLKWWQPLPFSLISVGWIIFALFKNSWFPDYDKELMPYLFGVTIIVSVLLLIYPLIENLTLKAKTGNIEAELAMKSVLGNESKTYTIENPRIIPEAQEEKIKKPKAQKDEIDEIDVI